MTIIHNHLIYSGADGAVQPTIEMERKWFETACKKRYGIPLDRVWFRLNRFGGDNSQKYIDCMWVGWCLAKGINPTPEASE